MLLFQKECLLPPARCCQLRCLHLPSPAAPSWCINLGGSAIRLCPHQAALTHGRSSPSRAKPPLCAECASSSISRIQPGNSVCALRREGKPVAGNLQHEAAAAGRLMEGSRAQPRPTAAAQSGQGSRGLPGCNHPCLLTTCWHADCAIMPPHICSRASQPVPCQQRCAPPLAAQRPLQG